MTVIKEVRQEIWKALFKMYMADDNNIYRWIYGKTSHWKTQFMHPVKRKENLIPQTRVCTNEGYGMVW